MRVGVPKEIKNHEYRVGLTPGSVRPIVVPGFSASPVGVAMAAVTVPRRGTLVIDGVV